MIEPLKIDVWSDLACPWCYIGKRRFAEGVRRFQDAGGGPVEIEYHSFELAPDTPVDFDGNEIDFLVEYKRMPADQVRQLIAHVVAQAEGEGLAYDFEALQHTNTRLAHQLLHHAKANGMQAEMKESLLSAYFVEGRHIGRIDDLVALAAEVGLDADDTRGALEAGIHAGDVQDDIDMARRIGVNGVPFFVLDGRYGISGAQPAEVFAQALAQAIED